MLDLHLGFLLLRYSSNRDSCLDAREVDSLKTLYSPPLQTWTKSWFTYWHFYVLPVPVASEHLKMQVVLLSTIVHGLWGIREQEASQHNIGQV